MEERTLNDVFDKLRPKQLDYIVWCIRRYTQRKNFNRGVLPFLPASEAVRCLKYHLEIGMLYELSDDKAPVVGIKFIRQLISTIGEVIPYQLHPEEITHELFLLDAKLQEEFGRRFGKKFCAFQRAVPEVNGLIQLEWVKKNWWKITTLKSGMEHAKEWLSDAYSS